MTRRRAEPRITSLATHPRRYVSIAVVAHYLGVDRKTVDKLGIPMCQFGSRRKIAIADLEAWEAQSQIRGGGPA